MSAIKRLAQAIGSSAEYAVAAALVAVVVVVGGAAFLLTLEDRPKRRKAAPAAVAEAPAEPAGDDLQREEQAALAEWQKILDSEVQERAPEPEPPPEPRREPPPAARSTPPPAGAASSAPAAAAAEAPRKPAAPPPQVAKAAPKAEPVRVAARLDRASCRPPKYPESAVRNREEGVVVLGFLLNKSGDVTDSRVEQSSGSRLLDRTAASALGRCRFNPGTVDGVPQGGWVQVRFAWKLDE